jgi:hypothetical protein
MEHKSPERLAKDHGTRNSSQDAKFAAECVQGARRSGCGGSRHASSRAHAASCAKNGRPRGKAIFSLSLMAYPGVGGIATRKVAVLIVDGMDTAWQLLTSSDFPRRRLTVI